MPRKSTPSVTKPATPFKAGDQGAEWAVYLLRKKAVLIGRVEAKDEKEALERACEEFKISAADRFRISVRKV